MPHIGELRERIALLEPKRAKATASGYVREDYRSYYECWAKVDYQPGGESGGHDSRGATFNAVITIRYPERLPGPTHAVEMPNGSVANVLSVRDPDQMRHWLEIICRGPA